MDADICFWKRLLNCDGGPWSHSWFLLLSMGPAEFASRLLKAALPWVKQQPWRAIQAEESAAEMTATEKIQRRVSVLQEVKRELCLALAKVHQASGASEERGGESEQREISLILLCPETQML